MDIKDKIVGQSILGREDFVEKILDRYLTRDPDTREQPSLRELNCMKAQNDVIRVVEEDTGKSLDEIKSAKGIMRNILMDLLYREGGLNNAEIGRLLNVDYSTVSQGRKTLRDRLKKDKKATEIVPSIEGKLSQIKI